MITLFDATSTIFTSNGLGGLNDAISCIVTEETNGQYELELEYPITGIHYSDLKLRSIIMAKPNPYADPQPFRIYQLSKNINGITVFNAQHISYDLSGYVVSPFMTGDVQDCLTKVKSFSVVSCPFTFASDKSTVGDIIISTPTSIRSILGKDMIEIYGGEYEFDKFSVMLHQQRGLNRGVSIRYGKNLTDLKQDENCNDIYTGVYPFWYSEGEEMFIQLSEKVINTNGSASFTKIFPLDLSSKFEEEPPTEEQLRAEGNAYIVANNIGVPKVSISVSFAQLTQSEEYKNFAILETVYLGDYVNVEFPELGVSAVSRCIKTVYDAVANKYESIDLGDAKPTLANTIVDSTHQNEIDIIDAKSSLQLAIATATDLINNALGGFVLKRNGELLIMDTEDPATAIKVWRWNLGGFGYSSTGVNGPYETAITMDGSIVGKFITALTVTAEQVVTGILKSKTGKCEFNLNSETFKLGNKLTFDGSNLVFGSGVKLSWSQIEDQPGIPSQYTDDQAVNAVKSTYIDAQNVWTITVKAQNIRTSNTASHLFMKDQWVDWVNNSKRLMSMGFMQFSSNGFPLGGLQQMIAFGDLPKTGDLSDLNSVPALGTIMYDNDNNNLVIQNYKNSVGCGVKFGNNGKIEFAGNVDFTGSLVTGLTNVAVYAKFA